jgi:hypothetical protein
MKFLRIVLSVFLSVSLALPPAFSWDQLAPAFISVNISVQDITHFLKRAYNDFPKDESAKNELKRTLHSSFDVVAHEVLPLSFPKESSKLIVFLRKTEEQSLLSIVKVAPSTDDSYLLRDHPYSHDFNAKNILESLQEKNDFLALDIRDALIFWGRVESILTGNISSANIGETNKTQDSSEGGALKFIGDEDAQQIPRKVLAGWKKEAAERDVVTHRIKGQFISAKWIVDKEQLHRYKRSAHHLWADKEKTVLIIVTDEPVKTNKSISLEKASHEYQEAGLRRKGYAPRNAHILATVIQIRDFAPKDGLTPYHQQQLDEMSPEQLKDLLKKQNRSYQHNVIKGKFGKDMLAKITAYEKRFRAAASSKLQSKVQAAANVKTPVPLSFLTRGLCRTGSQFLYETFGSTGGMISLDGPTGIGKSLFASLLEHHLTQSDFSGNVLVLPLDDFLTLPPWRYAMIKLMLGDPLTLEETALLTDADRARATGKDAFLLEKTFWQQDQIRDVLQRIREVLDSAPSTPLTYSFTVDAYDRTVERFVQKSYTVKQGDIVVVEGKYANLETLIPFFNFRYRLCDHEELIRQRYEARTRSLNPDKVALRLKSYSTIMWPGWLTYEEQSRSGIDAVIDLEDPLGSYQDVEKSILEALHEGPLTGKELMHKLPSIKSHVLWRAVMLSENVAVRFAGIHYPRIEKKPDGTPHPRLSPSLLREFHSYSAIARRDDSRIDELVERIVQQRKESSARRLREAKTIVMELAHRFPGREIAIGLSGDVAQDMAHDEKRINPLSGEIMDGSDFDFVVILGDEVTQEASNQVEIAFMFAQDVMQGQRIAPVEVDLYLFRASQLNALTSNNANDLKDAKNILHSIWLYGDQHLFEEAQRVLRETGMAEKIEASTHEAHRLRGAKRIALLSKDTTRWTNDDIDFFVGTFESFMELAGPAALRGVQAETSQDELSVSEKRRQPFRKAERLAQTAPDIGKITQILLPLGQSPNDPNVEKEVRQALFNCLGNQGFVDQLVALKKNSKKKLKEGLSHFLKKNSEILRAA